MLRRLRDNLMVLVILAAMTAALAAPTGGIWLQRYQAIPPLVMLIFACQGARVNTGVLADVGGYLRVVLPGAAVGLLLAPLLGWGAVTALHWQGDTRVGFLLMCAMAPTLVSGTIMAVQAGGEREAALLLTVLLNLLAVLSVPLVLGWLLGAGVAIDRSALFLKLLLYMLLPALVGQGVQRVAPAWVRRRETWLKYLPIVCLGLLIYIAVSQRAADLARAPWGQVVAVILPSAGVHYACMGVLWVLAGSLGVTAPRRKSLAIVGSQKTLPVAVAIWTTEFAAAYPLAIIPPIIFHFTQLYGDGFLAQYWASPEPIQQNEAPHG